MSAEGQNGLDPVYPASSEEYIVRFSTTEKSWLFQSMIEVIEGYRSSVRIFSPLSALYSLQQYYGNKGIKPFPCRGGKDYFYINAADSHAYPCGYRGMDDLGDYAEIAEVKKDTKNCTLCDWECFRDPSEFCGPLLTGLCNPFRLLTTYRRDSTFYRYWLQDLSYYRACNLFDGRTDSNNDKLRKFAQPGNKSFPIEPLLKKGFQKV